MNLSSHVDFLREAESRYPVDDWRIGDLRVWPLIRYHLSVSNLAIVNRTRSEIGGLGRRVSSAFRGELNWARARISDSAHFQRATRSSDVLLYGDGVSQMFVGGRWYDRFCDPLAERCEALGYSTALWTPLSHFQVPRARSSWFIQPSLDSLGAWCKLTHNLSRASVRLDRYTEFAEWVRSKFPNARVQTQEAIRKVAYYVEQHTRFYEALLARSTPKVCFIVSYYGTERFSFVRACRLRGVPVVDVQHGYAGDRHWAYSGWTRVPRGGFDMLPDRFWRWSNDERDVIEAWARVTGGAHRSEVSGNVFLSAWWQRRFPGIDESVRAARQVHDEVPVKRHVLFTLNGFETQEMLARLAAVFEREREKYFIWFRMHPSRLGQQPELERFFRALLPQWGNVQEASTLPLPAVLETVDIHLTEISTTVLEAEHFGVPSVILGRSRAPLYQAQIDRGIAVIAPEIDDIPEALDKLCTQGRVPRSERGFSRPWDVLLLELLGPAAAAPGERS